MRQRRLFLLRPLAALLFFLPGPATAQFLPPTNLPNIPDTLPGAKRVLNNADQLRTKSNADAQTKNQGTTKPTNATPSGGKSSATSSSDSQAVSAARKGQINEYKTLVERGANPSAVDSSQSTALHYAAYRGDGALVDFLLEHKGIIVNAVDDRGNTPLHLASSTGHEEILRKLIGAGADPKLKNSDGNTPLLRAAAQGEAGCVKALLELGSSASEVDNRGRNARQLVEKNRKGRWEEVLSLLTAAEANKP